MKKYCLVIRNMNCVGLYKYQTLRGCKNRIEQNRKGLQAYEIYDMTTENNRKNHHNFSECIPLELFTNQPNAYVVNYPHPHFVYERMPPVTNLTGETIPAL